MKVLVLSHNVLSENSSMGRTLFEFLKGVLTENLAQLYFHSEFPTIDICKKYFRITDFDILKKRKENAGTEFVEKDIQCNLKTSRIDTKTERKIYNYGKKRKPYMYIGRNLLWATKKWKNRKLLNWINDFNPDVIFFASGDYVFAYKLAMEIAEIRNIPIVTYICDDYYFVRKKSVSPLYYINRIWYKKTLKKLFSKHKNVVSICDKITTDYGNEFGVFAKTIMTSSDVIPFESKSDKDNIVISYLGNFGYNRVNSIVEIGRALKEISDNKVFIDVYSAETRPEIIKHLTFENGINFHGCVSYNEVKEIMKESDILIHAESMNELDAEKVRYSVSTKIADSISCGRCLFAYGPSDVASMEYLKENECACVVTDQKDLKKALQAILYDNELRNKYVQKGLEIAKKNHDSAKNSQIFQKILTDAVRDKDESNADKLCL